MKLFTKIGKKEKTVSGFKASTLSFSFTNEIEISKQKKNVCYKFLKVVNEFNM